MAKAKTINVETKIKFEVIKGQSKAVDTYHTGDYNSMEIFKVVRKQMASDIPKQQGGTKKCAGGGYSEDLVLKQNKEGVQTICSFINDKLAIIVCKALNATPQKELKKLMKHPYGLI